MKNKINAIQVGISGFPFGTAAINRCLAIYNVLRKEDIYVLAINIRSRHDSNIPVEISKEGMFDNIQYYYTTPSPFKPSNFLKRRLYNVIGRLNEFLLLVKLGTQGKIDIMFFYPDGNFFELIYYRVLSKIFRFPLITHYVEYRTAFESRKKIWMQINDRLFDKYFINFVDGILPISEYLIEHIQSRGFRKDYLKIPPIIEFKLFDNIQKSKQNIRYFLYCGNLGYSRTIDQILEAFKLVKDKRFSLYLILSGSNNDLQKVIKRIEEHPKKDQIRIFSKLEYGVLIQYFYDASALLVPLSDRIQDTARFPNKIAEYSATGNPIISTDYGEVKHYFKDGINALISKTDSIDCIAEKMNFVTKNKSLSKLIGEKGRITGLEYFDSLSYQKKLKNYILKIIEA